jgi:aldehyde dehydrogenase (NAD+)
MNTPDAAYPGFLQRGPLKLLVDGKWIEAASGKTFDTLNPATGLVLAKVAEGDREDIDKAVAAARRALAGPWQKMKPFDRQQLILRFADLVERNFDELALIDTLDMGAPIQRTLSLRRRLLGLLRWYAGMATALHGQTIENSAPGEYVTYTLKEPVGVVGAIIPWNGPLIAALWKIGPVLTTGCTLVLKPAEEASLAALRFGELLMEAGCPDGVVNIVTGYGETAGATLAAHPDVDKIAFTGSVETGSKIVQASRGNLKRLSLELGGKSPNIVFSDADMEATVEGAAMAVFGNTGQVCSAGTRLFVEDRIYDEFVERVAAFGRGLKIGDGTDPDVQVGPLVSEQQLKRVSHYLDIGREERARMVTGGTRLVDGDLARGYFVSPTVFADVGDDMRIAREEIFGPVISALPFTSIEDVARRANNTSYGLASGVWTRDIGKAHFLAKAIRAGSVWVNCYQMMDPAMPFGGYKMSGYGRDSGVEQFDDYVNTKAVWIKAH